MKKSFYLFMMFIGLALTSCEPMEDIHEEVDADIAARPVEGIAEYTLTEDDYDALDVSFNSFNSLDDAANLIPNLLAEQFPIWGEGSLARVTFDLYAPIEVESYMVTAADYEALGLEVDYFSDLSEARDFLSFQFPQAPLNEYIELTYKTIAVDEEFTFSDEDFELVEEELIEVYPEPADNAGYHGSFDRRESRATYWSNEMILEAINVVLGKRLPGIEGQTYEVKYAIYDGNPGTESMKVRFNGNSYEQFGGERYQLTDADYELIGAEFAEEYPAPAASAAQYNNFDTGFDDDAVWSEDMILEALNWLLMEKFPDAEEGDVFNVTYESWDGARTYPTVSLVLENGEFVESDAPAISTVEESTVFAHGGDSWVVPLELPRNIYTEEFEQRYNNFGDEDDAGFYIGRYLEPRYPYAEEGDFVSVKYRYFNGDATVNKYISFIYEDREWIYIPTVIPQTLQFGHEGTGWVVDNTIVYTLATADYVLIGEELSDEYTDPAWSVGNYENFDRRPGNRNQWTDAMLLEAFNILLNQQVAPDAEEGQKYLLSFDTYTGTATVETMHLIKVDGVWIPVE